MARGIARSVTGAPSGLRDIMNLELWKESLNQLHAVSHPQLGRQREPSVKTFRSPLLVECSRHCVLSGRTQRICLVIRARK